MQTHGAPGDWEGLGIHLLWLMTREGTDLGWGGSATTRPGTGLPFFCVSQRLSLLLQYSTSTTELTDGSTDQGVLWESDGPDAFLESQVIALLWHPVPSDVAHQRR